MEALPLKKELYEQAKALGVKQIILNWTGGSDEGFLNVQINGTEHTEKIRKLWGEVEEWAYDSYGYSGAGDGTEYGDDITYDLVTNKVSTQEWYHVVSYGEESNDTLETR